VKTFQQIEEYFQGKHRKFNIPIRMKGTDFHIKVWNFLSRIPFETLLASERQLMELEDFPKQFSVL